MSEKYIFQALFEMIVDNKCLFLSNMIENFLGDAWGEMHDMKLWLISVDTAYPAPIRGLSEEN